MTEPVDTLQSVQDATTDEMPPAPLVTPKALVSRTRTVRAILTGEDFLAFHEISGRVVFHSGMSVRDADEELVKIAIRRLKREIDERLKDGEVFISAESLL